MNNSFLIEREVTLDLQWNPTNQARLRVKTGTAGDKVTLTFAAFTPNIALSADNTYTATTDSEGFAYFYGTMAEQTEGFIVSLTAVTMVDGEAAFTCPLSPLTLKRMYKLTKSSLTY